MVAGCGRGYQRVEAELRDLELFAVALRKKYRGLSICAADDEAVRCFGRDDVFLWGEIKSEWRRGLWPVSDRGDGSGCSRRRRGAADQ